MDRLAALRLFTLVAQTRSFAAAARLLRVSPTAASRAVAALERELGAALLMRTTRSVRLTAAGAAYLERCRRILEELDDADRLLRGESGVPHGTLTLSAPVVLGRMHVLPVVLGLLRDHAGLNVRLMLTDRLVRLVDEGVDAAIRIAALSDSALRAVRLTEVRRVLVASPAYLAARGTPQTIAELARHDLIVFEAEAPNAEWRFTASGKPALRVAPRLLTDNVDAAIAACLGGLGVARVLDYQVAELLAAGKLQALLAPLAPPPLPVSLVFPPNRQGSANLRVFLTAAQAYFRRLPRGDTGGA